MRALYKILHNIYLFSLNDLLEEGSVCWVVDILLHFLSSFISLPKSSLIFSRYVHFVCIRIICSCSSRFFSFSFSHSCSFFSLNRDFSSSFFWTSINSASLLCMIVSSLVISVPLKWISFFSFLIVIFWLSVSSFKLLIPSTEKKAID